MLLLIATLLLLMSLAALINANPANPVLLGLYWLFSWLPQCFAPQLVILAAVIAVFNSNATSPSGLTAVMAMLDIALLLLIYYRGRETAAVIDFVVDEALAKIGVQASSLKAAGSGTSSGNWAGLRPLHFSRAGVTKHMDIAYGDARPGNLLDIYQPVNKPQTAMPVLIQVPGGAWVTGSKNEQGLPLLYQMAEQGWTCFAINYRLGPKSRFPAMLEDVLAAIAWVKAHASDYGANPDFIAITGGSAGGHLISLAALLRDSDRARFQPGFEQADTRVSVAVPIYGRYDFLNRHQFLPGRGLEPFLNQKVMPGPPASDPELWEFASPESQVHADAPPFLVIHGSKDSLIPVVEARGFVRALSAVSTQPVDYAELAGAEHGFDMVHSSWATPSVNAVARFLAGHYQRYLLQSEQSQAEINV
jgi:acetyl esterase/lipase